MALGSLVVAALACGLPARSASPTEPATETAPASPTPEPEELVALSLVEAIAAGVESGAWTESEGIVTGLRYLVGEVSPEDAFGETPLLNGEGTGAIRVAQHYLADASHVEGRDEIERLLAILVPSRETLDRFAQPAMSSLNAPGLALTASRPVGDRAECQTLWASGFASPLPLVCLEYEELALAGETYRVYYPSYWTADHPGRSLLDPAFEALESSVRRFNGYGPQPVISTDIVFTDLDALVRSRTPGEWLRDPSIYAAADRPPDPADAHCPVGIFPAAVDQAADSVGAFQQTIAHELFHCYQYTNLKDEEAGPAESANEWWVEGSAEFFGSIVYPDVNDEFQYLPGFESRSSTRSLLSWSYHAYPFFLYMAVQEGLGEEGVVDLLRAMPEAGGEDGQQEALAGFPGIQEAFHEFGRAFLDRQLQDYGGGLLPVNPAEGAVATFGRGEGEGFFPTDVFRLKRYRLNFNEDTRFTVSKMIEGEGKHGARPISAVGSWGEVPIELNTACGEGQFLLLVTSANPPGGEDLSMAVTTLGEEVEEELPCDECVVGTWVLDNSTYLSHMGRLWPIVIGDLGAFGLSTEGAQSFPTNTFGNMVISFSADGSASGYQEAWGIAGKAVKDDKVVTGELTFSGAGEATWRIETDETTRQEFLFFDNRAFDIVGHMTFQGFPLRQPIPFADSNDSVFLSTPQPFTCTDTTLTYYVGDPTGPVVFRRDVQEATP
jgi:hypothetical protein